MSQQVVPARALGWEDDFQVPCQFDIEIMRMVEKSNYTKSAKSCGYRSSSLDARPLSFPTNNQYQVVASHVSRYNDRNGLYKYIKVLCIRSCCIHIFIANDRRTIKNKNIRLRIKNKILPYALLHIRSV